MHPAFLASTAQSSTGSSFASLIIFLLIPVGMYFLLIRPQRKRQREQVAMQQSVQVGDEVMTTSGIYGWVAALDGDIAVIDVDVLEIKGSPNVQLRIARAAIQQIGRAHV